MVDHIEVTNKSVAKVYVYNSAPQDGTSGTVDEMQTDGRQSTNGNRNVRYKYYFNIGSVESFERKLEDAQDTLGVDPHDYIPVTYVSEMSWQQELLRLAPTLLIIAGYIFFTRRMQGGFGVGGGGGAMGGRGIFNVGKAQVTKLNQKAKDKVHI
jgi:AFG3 family protein